MNSFPNQSLESITGAAIRIVEAFPKSDPEFGLDIQWAADYDALFAKTGPTSSEAELLVQVSNRGRCLIVGRGGAGKTRMLHRLMRNALEKKWVPIFVDLKMWVAADYPSWREWTASDIGTGAAFLLERFSQPRTDPLALDALRPDVPKLLIVDGLNELAAPVGEQILVALDEFARNVIGMSVLAADRWSRRNLPSPKRWALGAVLPISSAQIHRYVGSTNADHAALSTPYFLDAAIKKESLGSSNAETLGRYFSSHGKLDEAETLTIAHAAFAAYSDSSTRTFLRSEFAEKAGNKLVERLLEAGILVVGDGDRIHFFHHLLHDFMAAKHVAAMSDEAWSAKVFQAISFGGSSFDTISMVFSLLAMGRADRFLRSVYDWNPYAAAYALTDSITAAAAPSKEIQNVIFAMLAEKCFDIVEPTSQQARDALSLIESPDVAKYRDSKSLKDLLQLVRSVDSEEEWFKQWRRLFTLDGGDVLSDAEFSQIDTADSVLGWTLANVAKRIQLSSEQQAMVRKLAALQKSTTRWRAAHVLGAWPSPENLAALAALIDETNDESVRYGAIRSMIEAAARGGTPFQEAVLGLLKERASSVARNSKLVDEAKRAMWIRPESAPSTWLGLVKAVSLMLYEFDEGLEGRDSWQLYVEKAEIRYRDRAAAASR